MEMTQDDIHQIVEAVVANLTPAAVQQAQPDQLSKYAKQGTSIYDGAVGASSPIKLQTTGAAGVYADPALAVQRAYEAQAKYVEGCKLEDRKRIIEAVRQSMMQNKEKLARIAIEETGLGRYEDKIAKVALAATATPGVEIITTSAVSGDNGLTIEEMAPFGVIGAVTPVTNPMETIINNCIGMLAAGNSVVFNVHPSSRKTCVFTVNLINQAITAAGGPPDLVTLIENPTMESLDSIMKNDKVRLLLGTGGPGLVKKLLSSGKKAIGAAAGNPPVIVDETADLELAAREIIKGASFDNNLLCIAEKEVFALNSIYDDLLFSLLKQGTVLLTPQQAEEVTGFALQKDEKGGWHTQKEWIGKDASKFLHKVGITDKDDAHLLIFEAQHDHPFVQLEQMMPVLPIVRVNTLQEAIMQAVSAEHGNRHTASMFSRNVDNLTAFARAVNTTIFVKNAATLAGVGFGGEGYTTFTIAGATGEGLTCAKTFTRTRRCVLGEGGFRIM